MNNLVIPIEVFVRDFDPRFYFALKASKFFNVYVGEQQDILTYIYKLNPGIYFDKSISINKNKLYKRLTSLGWKIVSIDEEGLAIHTNTHKYLNHRINNLNLRLVDKFFTWSDFEKNSLINKYPNLHSKFIATGNLRFEYCRYISNKNKNNISKTILISSSLVGNHRLGEIGLKKLFNDLGRLKKNEDEVEYDKKRKETRISSQKFYDFISDLIKINCDYNFIIRPHPAENPKKWILLSQKFDNLIVQKPDKPIIDTFKNVTALIHSGCTTAFEACAYGLETFYFEASNSYNISKKISSIIHEKTNLTEIINSNNDIFPKIEEFSFLNSSQRTLDALSNINVEKNFGFIKVIKSSIFYFLKRILKNKSSSKESHKFKYNCKNDLLDYINKKKFDVEKSKLIFVTDKIINIK